MQPTTIKLKTAEERAAAAQEIIDIYYNVPHYFVKDIIGANTWYMQDEIIQSVFKYPVTAVKTCNAIGKSFVAARIAYSYLLLHPGSIVVTTAPTWRQVTDVLWREIATTVKLSKVKLTNKEVTQAGLNLDTDWYAVGLSTKTPENFFGYHADHILVIVDEAGGVPELVFKGVKAITPNANARVLYIGNPTNPDGTFAEAFKNPRIKKFTISAFDTPNFTANGIHDVEDLLKLFTPPEGMSEDEELDFYATVRGNLNMPYPALIDPYVVYERYFEWGVDSPAWQALVMGEFPSQSELSLLSIDSVMFAMGDMDKKDDDPESPHYGKSFAEIMGIRIPEGPREYGLDMARFGTDLTVLTPRNGGHIGQQITWAKSSLTESADKVINIINPHEVVSMIKIDDTGNGGGTTDSLNEKKRLQGIDRPYLYQVMPINFASGPQNKAKFHDITSEMYWNLKQWFDGKKLTMPYDEKLFRELVGRRWSLVGGKIKVENKDDYKKRTGGKSPDRSDSLALALYRSKPGEGTRPVSTDHQLDEHRREVARPITADIGNTSGQNRRY